MNCVNVFSRLCVLLAGVDGNEWTAMISPMPLARLMDVGCEDAMVQRPVVVDMDLCLEVAGSAAPRVAAQRCAPCCGGALCHMLWRSAHRGGTDTGLAARCLMATDQARDVRCATLVAELRELSTGVVEA